MKYRDVATLFYSLLFYSAANATLFSDHFLHFTPARPISHLTVRNAQTRRCVLKTRQNVLNAPQQPFQTGTQPRPTTATISESPPKSTGTITVQVPRCGPNGATTTTTQTTGPNGKLDWLNCGITPHGDGPWNPPYITPHDVVAVDLSKALKTSDTFSPCANYINLFEKYAGQVGVAAIFLASFAMQESGCQASMQGGNGEQGMMQITPDKCVGAPGGDCTDPDFNIQTAAIYFAGRLEANNNDLLLSIGEYNGWHMGMTYFDATNPWTVDGHCFAQNNLDYLFQFLNGWILNLNAYTMNLGEYHNLAGCK